MWYFTSRQNAQCLGVSEHGVYKYKMQNINDQQEFQVV